MKPLKILLLGLTGLGAVAVAGMGSVALAAPKASLEEVVEVLRGVLSVQVVNSEPVKVSPVLPVEEPIVLTFGAGTSNFVVPEGKLLVIQAVSFDVNADAFPNIEHPPSGSIFSADFTPGNVDIDFFFFAINQRVSGFDKWVTHAQTTFYAAAGREVGADITPFAGADGRATLSGVLRNAP